MRKSETSLLSSGTPHYRSHVLQPYCYKVGYLSWRHIHHLRNTGRKEWLCKANQVKQKLGFHTSILYMNTSTSRWSAGLSQHLSRVRNTLDTVSKAVSGTHTELLSKITRLKPNALKAGEKAELSVESTVKAEENALTSTPPTAAALSASSSSSKPKPPCDSSSASPSILTSGATVKASATTSPHPHSLSQETVTATVLTVTEPKEKRLRRVVPTVKAGCARKQEELKPSLSDSESKSTTSKQTTELFHPSTFSVSLDETYNYMAHHINSYFNSSTKTQEKTEENVGCSSASSQGPQTSELMPVSHKKDSAPQNTLSSTKKGLGHYLSYSAPTVQAFVGSYIAPLVPKFRTTESKSVALEEKSEDALIKQAELTVSKEQKAAEEKARKLLLQREKVCLQNGHGLF